MKRGPEMARLLKPCPGLEKLNIDHVMKWINILKNGILNMKSSNEEFSCLLTNISRKI